MAAETMLTPCPIFREDDDHSDCSRCEGKRFVAVPARKASGWQGAGSVGGGMEGAAKRSGEKALKKDRDKRAKVTARSRRPVKPTPGTATREEWAEQQSTSRRKRSDQTYDKLGWRSIKAKYPGRCGVCRGRVRRGQSVLWRVGEVRHPRCLPGAVGAEKKQREDSNV